MIKTFKKRILIFLISCIVLFACKPHFVNALIEEYTLKAVFIEKFTRFIDWPDDLSSLSNESPFTIGIFGRSKIKNSLTEVFSATSIKNRKVKIIELNDLEAIKDCNILFISDVNDQKLQDILKLTQNKPILTISDQSGFAQKGVLINFYLLENKVRFEIGEQSLKETPLKFSYLLLKMAKIVSNVQGEKI